PYPEFEGALPPPEALEAYERYDDALVYEARMGSSLTTEMHKTFHFVLGTHRTKDNRIPPRGFRIAEASTRLTEPVWDGQVRQDYFSADEYAGGYDQVELTTVPGGSTVQVRLFYQTTSREYVEFLRDEIDGRGETLPGPGVLGDPAYLAQDDPFFSGLKAWGGTIWKLWKHNRDVPGAAPFLLAQATVGGTLNACPAPVPTLLAATPGHQQVQLLWDALHDADPVVSGYAIYYDQAGKSQPVAQTGPFDSYTDSGLTNGQLYCYKVSAIAAGCESATSNVLCAVPSNKAVNHAGLVDLASGYEQKSGKGKGATSVFVATGSFAVGDRVLLQGRVLDIGSGLPLEGATADFNITGPTNVTVTSGPSDGDGRVTASWQTAAPNKRGQGGTPPGSYAARVADIHAGGHAWDGFDAPVTFTLE
ncbi:MAG TPA: fibronectin type III domain-containing protein, partial [Gammaproteobacteria bacterium]